MKYRADIDGLRALAIIPVLFYHIGVPGFGGFYKRRILRILPALLVMLLVTSVLAYLYFLPVELEDYSWSLAGAIGSVSNIREDR